MSKFKRSKLDGAYMFAAVFAGIGGLMLLGSYASSRPVETFNQGKYNLANYASTSPDIFNLGLNSKYDYCFSPVKKYKTTVISIENSNETFVPVKYNIAQENTICIKPKSNFANVKVKIVPVPQVDVNLRVLNL